MFDFTKWGHLAAAFFFFGFGIYTGLVLNQGATAIALIGVGFMFLTGAMEE